MRIPVMIAALCAYASAARAVELGPLAPAADGKVSCFSPNNAAKTCSSIDIYKVAPNGEIRDEAVEIVSASPLIVMTSHTTVSVRGDTECAVARTKDYFSSATFAIEGRPADAAQTARLRANLQIAVKPLLGHKVCAVYRAQGDGQLATFSIDGTPAPQLDRRMIWVSAADGWRVGF